MPLSQDQLIARFQYLNLCLNELEDWLESSLEEQPPVGFLRVVERLYQVIVDELVGICRWYLNDETDLAPSERTARRAVQVVGSESWVNREVLDRFMKIYLDRRNRLVHSPEHQSSSGLEEEAAYLVRDAQRFVEDLRLGFCPNCEARLRFQRNPGHGSLGRCPVCDTPYQVSLTSPIVLTNSVTGDFYNVPTGAGAAAGSMTSQMPAQLPELLDEEPQADLPGEPPVEATVEEPSPNQETIQASLFAGSEPVPELEMETPTEAQTDQQDEEPLRESVGPGPAADDLVYKSSQSSPPQLPAEPAWKQIYQQALSRYANALLTRKGFDEARTLFQKAVELGCSPAYRNLGIMARLGQGSQKDFEQAIKQFNKGIKNGDGRCHAELALLYAERRDLARAAAKWKDYFNSQAFIHNQVYQEQGFDRQHYAAEYLLFVLSAGLEPLFWDRAAPYWETAAARLQEQIDTDRKAKRWVDIQTRGKMIDRLRNLAGQVGQGPVSAPGSPK